MVPPHQDESINVLDFSANARHWLEEAGLRTVLQVAVAWYNGDVQKHWASNSKANVRILADIRERLESHLLRHPDVAKRACIIGGAGSSSSAPRPPNLRPTQPNQSSPSREVSKVHETERPSVAKARPSTSLDSLHLSRHSYLALETQGIRTVEQLMVISEETLRNVAPLSVRFTEEINIQAASFLEFSLFSMDISQSTRPVCTFPQRTHAGRYSHSGASSGKTGSGDSGCARPAIRNETCTT